MASALHFDSLARRRRSVYTCPIKALVNEKWMALCRELGPENVGLATGDATVNRDAPVLCCTAEILANTHFEDEKRNTLEPICGSSVRLSTPYWSMSFCGSFLQ